MEFPQGKYREGRKACPTEEEGTKALLGENVGVWGNNE